MKLIDFGQAIQALKNGMKITRKDWKDQGIWLIFVEGYQMGPAYTGSFYERKGITQAYINPHIAMRTETGAMQAGWLPTVADLMAEDWLVINTMTHLHPINTGWYWYELPGEHALQPCLVTECDGELMYTLDAVPEICDVRKLSLISESDPSTLWSSEPFSDPVF